MSKNYIIGGLGVLLLLMAGLTFVMRNRYLDRLSEMEARMGELTEQEKQSAIDRRVSRQMEEIAYSQQELSEERSREAIRQKLIAQEMTLRSEAERGRALEAQAHAEKSAQEALASYNMAEQQRKEADTQRQQAERAKRVADTLNYISLGRTLGSLSYSIYRAGDREIGNMLAYTSYLYTMENGGNLYSSSVFPALTQSAGGTQDWNVHSGTISTLEFFPNSNRLLSVSLYGEMKTHELINGGLQTKTLFSNKAFCFRDVYASNSGKAYTVSHTGYLVVARDGKTNVIPLNNMTKPFRMEPMNDDRQLLIVGEKSIAVLDIATDKVMVTRQLGYNIQNCSRIDNKPLLFDDKGCMHRVISADNITTEKMPVKGTVTAYAWSRNENLSAYGMKDGTIYLLDKKGKVRKLMGHLSQVTRLKFVGKRLYSSSLDGKLLFWMTDDYSHKPITLLQSGSWLTDFTLDGKKNYIWTGEQNGKLTRYLISLPMIAQRLKDKVKRNFTQEEWNHYVGKGIPYRRIDN
ncbi:MAG: hypothetical protein IKO82_06830 [Prevotella sp.]|nr:hypothetical protein [Prevotella sp.]